MHRTFVAAAIFTFAALSLVVFSANAQNSTATGGGNSGNSTYNEQLSRFMDHAVAKDYLKDLHPNGAMQLPPDPSRYKYTPRGNTGGTATK